MISTILNFSFPVQTIFDAGDQGVVAMALTPDARYLATVSAGTPQVLCIWDWTTEGDHALCSATLDPSYGVQNFILFNPDDTTQIVSSSETQVIFYAWVSAMVCSLRRNSCGTDEKQKRFSTIIITTFPQLHTTVCTFFDQTSTFIKQPQTSNLFNFITTMICTHILHHTCNHSALVLCCHRLFFMISVLTLYLS